MLEIFEDQIFRNSTVNVKHQNNLEPSDRSRSKNKDLEFMTTKLLEEYNQWGLRINAEEK